MYTSENCVKKSAKNASRPLKELVISLLFKWLLAVGYWRLAKAQRTKS